MAKSTPGPEPKGDRAPVTLRVHRPYRAMYKEAADAAGLSLNDYLDQVLARAHGVPEPPYLARNPDQPPLMATG